MNFLQWFFLMVLLGLIVYYIVLPRWKFSAVDVWKAVASENDDQISCLDD